jgi:hypothetical protein
MNIPCRKPNYIEYIKIPPKYESSDVPLIIQ